MEDFGIWDECGAVKVHFLDDSPPSQAVVDSNGKLVYLKNSDEKRPEGMSSDGWKKLQPLLSTNHRDQLPLGPQPPFYPWDMRGSGPLDE